MMKKELVILLGFVLLCSFIIGLVYVFFIPSMARFIRFIYPNIIVLPLLTYVVLYLTAIPIVIIIYHMIKLLIQLYRFGSFEAKHEKSFIWMIRCGFVFSAIFVCSLPLFYVIVEFDDSPGLLVIALFVSSFGITLSVFTNVLRKLLFQQINNES